MKQPLSDFLKGVAHPLRKRVLVQTEDDGNEYTSLGPYLDLPLTVGVAIHRRQYTFFLSSINDICKEQKKKKNTINFIKHKPNTLVSTEQTEKNEKVYIVVLTLPAGNRSDWSARICPKRQPTYRMAKDL